MSTAKTEREYRLGVENAKLAKKIHQQRIALNGRGITATDVAEFKIAFDSAHREMADKNRRMAALATENRALRLYIAEHKIAPLSFMGLLRLWLSGRHL